MRKLELKQKKKTSNARKHLKLGREKKKEIA